MIELTMYQILGGWLLAFLLGVCFGMIINHSLDD